MQACTIVARNYLPQARVLARSFREHHSDSPFTVLLIDGAKEDAGTSEDFTALDLTDIELAPGEMERMTLIYDVLELSTAVKPWLLRRLLRSGPDVVFYFDPDIEIFAALSDLAALAREHSIVLTPHVLLPIPRDGLMPSESDILQAGVYNLGFLAVGPGSEPFLDWWAERLRRDAIVDPDNMLFTDQRWVDFVPALFPHHILRDPACNVAYWNLGPRPLHWTGSGYTVHERPLRFFHYSGYEPDRPEVLSKYQGDAPRVRLESEPALARLCEDYRRKLLAAGYAENRDHSYGHGAFDNGTPIPPGIRRLYRAALLQNEATSGGAPENLQTGGTAAALLDWLHGPLDALRPLDYVIGQTIDFGRQGNSEPHRLAGWGATERHYTWSVARTAQIGLRIQPQRETLQLELLAGAFVHAPERPAQRVEVYAQGRKLADWTIARAKIYRATIPAEATVGGEYLSLEFRLPDAVSPRDLLRDRPDERVLGICVHHLQLVRAPWWRRLRSILP